MVSTNYQHHGYNKYRWLFVVTTIIRCNHDGSVLGTLSHTRRVFLYVAKSPRDVATYKKMR